MNIYENMMQKMCSLETLNERESLQPEKTLETDLKLGFSQKVQLIWRKFVL